MKALEAYDPEVFVVEAIRAGVIKLEGCKSDNPEDAKKAARTDAAYILTLIEALRNPEA